MTYSPGSTTSKGLFFFLFKNDTKESYLLKYQTSNDPSQTVINNLITEFSRHKSTSVYYITFTFSHDQKIQITRDGVKVFIRLDILNFEAKDVFYKGFKIADVIFPPIISFSGELTNKKNEILKQFSITNQSLNPEINTFNFEYTDSTYNKDYSFRITNKTFTYNQSNQLKRTNYQKDIDNYYDAVKQIDNLLEELYRIDVNDISMIYDNEKLTKEINRNIIDLENLKFELKLDLKNYDPASYLNKIADLKKIHTEIVYSIQHTLASLHEIYYNKGLEYAVNDRYAAAREMFLKSLEVNPSFAPALYQLANLDFKNNKIDDASIKLFDLLTKLKPDPVTYDLAMDLCRKVFRNFLDQAETFNQSENYENALQILVKAEKFCQSIPHFNCNKRLYDLRNVSRNGVYQILISSAKAELSKGNLDEALKNINAAIDYQKEFSVEIPDPSFAIQVLNQIRHIEYLKFIEAGKLKLNAASYQEAFDNFIHAQELENKYQFDKSEELINLIKSALKPILLLSLDEGFELLQMNNVVKARIILQKTAFEQKKYGLTEDKEINAKYELLREEITKVECKKAEENYLSYLMKARQFVLSKDYIEADRNFDLAINVVIANLICEINKTEAETEKLSISPASTYQKKLKEINGHIDYNRS